MIDGKCHNSATGIYQTHQAYLVAHHLTSHAIDPSCADQAAAPGGADLSVAAAAAGARPAAAGTNQSATAGDSSKNLLYSRQHQPSSLTGKGSKLGTHPCLAHRSMDSVSAQLLDSGWTVASEPRCIEGS